MEVNKGHKVLGAILCVGKAFFNSIVAVVWGIASIFLLTSLITYYKADASAITLLLNLSFWIMDNWGLFVGIFFLYDFISSYKGFIKPIIEDEIKEITVSTTKIDKTKKKEVKL